MKDELDNKKSLIEINNKLRKEINKLYIQAKENYQEVGLASLNTQYINGLKYAIAILNEYIVGEVDENTIKSS